MSSILDQLADKGTVSQVEKGATWVNAALAAARDELGKTTPNSETATVAQTALYGLNKIAANKAQFDALGYPKTIAFLARVAIGQNEQAASILSAYGGGQGAWGDADSRIANAGDKTERAKRDQDAGIAFAKEIGSAAAKAALPLLMAAVF